MKISILCSSKNHPVYTWLCKWKADRDTAHKVELVQTRKELSGGDILFLISCNEIIGPAIREKYRTSLVIHASNVPEGRGWSPHIWQILEGKSEISVTLLEAEDKVDSGNIWAQKNIKFEGHELSNEINEKLFAVEIDLMDYAVENFTSVRPRSQPNLAPSYYRKRNPEDSRIDPERSIAEQFNLLRVADPERFPAFFEFRGQCYRIRLDKIKKSEE